jgi:flagellar hook protein FlgE
MSIFDAMRTSVSGMNGQAARISVYSDNIANTDTVGYKAASAQFETLVTNTPGNAYSSGAIDPTIRYGISQQGSIQATTSPTDLAIQGAGFFVVADQNGAPHLTRSGSFIPDASGHLVNTAGFRLMGASAGGGTSGTSLAGLSIVKIDQNGLVAAPSTAGELSANLPAGAAPATTLPSANVAAAAGASKTSLVSYDNLGAQVTLDIYFAKTGSNAWEATAFDSSTATGGGFPYGSGPLAVSALTFEATTGKLSAGSLAVPIPNGRTLSLDLSGVTQLGAAFSVSQVNVNGQAPSQFKSLEVDASGLISAVYQNGATSPKFQIQLATVPSVDNLAPATGNIFDITEASGAAVLGAPGAGPFGAVMSASLESSTVDIASQLTDMIETQRSYTANSKAFQVASDVTDVLMNLKV